MPEDGLISIRSDHTAEATVARIEADLAAKGLTLFAKINHPAEATEAGAASPLATLLLFGGTAADAALMQACQRAGISLPLKAMVWEEENGTVWLTYSDPAWLARRHAPGPQTEPAAIHAVSAMLRAIARYGTAADCGPSCPRSCGGAEG
jgi:uncharacterized protein (DUF302 family)